jgi:hypothetical protein
LANKPKSGGRQTNGWDVLRQVVTSSFNSGYAVVLLGGLIFLGSLSIVVQKLDSKDLRELILGFFAPWFVVLGWLLFLLGSGMKQKSSVSETCWTDYFPPTNERSLT